MASNNFSPRICSRKTVTPRYYRKIWWDERDIQFKTTFNNSRRSPSIENPVFIIKTMVEASDNTPTISWVDVTKKKTPSRESSFMQNSILWIVFCRSPRFLIFPRTPDRRDFLSDFLEPLELVVWSGITTILSNFTSNSLLSISILSTLLSMFSGVWLWSFNFFSNKSGSGKFKVWMLMLFSVYDLNFKILSITGLTSSLVCLLSCVFLLIWLITLSMVEKLSSTFRAAMSSRALWPWWSAMVTVFGLTLNLIYLVQ